jgi:hypothetical protein
MGRTTINMGGQETFRQQGWKAILVTNGLLGWLGRFSVRMLVRYMDCREDEDMRPGVKSY